MRLTLRTLLAWRDQTLSPADRADLDAKVAASEAAHVLSARIDRAIADDALAAPHGHAAADPNAVAEYLDNVLPASALDGFERGCLQSDELLAEVAASHRLLAEVSLDPQALPPLGRAEHQRLLAAFRARAAAAARAAAGTEGAGTEGTGTDGTGSEGAAIRTGIPGGGHQGGGNQDRHQDRHPGETMRTGIPEGVSEGAGLPGEAGSKDTPGRPEAVVVRPPSADSPASRAPAQSSRTAWLLAVAAVLLLGGLTGVLAWSVGRGRLVATRAVADAAGRPSGDVAPRAALEPVVEPAPAPAATVASGGEPAAPAVPPLPPASDTAAATPSPVVRPPVAVDEPPPAPPVPAIATMAAREATSPSPAATTVPFGDALAIAARPIAPAAAPPPGAPAIAPAAAPPPVAPAIEPADAPAPPADALAVIGDDPLLFSPVDPGEAEPQAWIVARAGDRPNLPTRVLAPAFSRPALEIDGVRVLLTPGTRGTLRRDEAGTAWLDVDIGAAVVVGAPGPSPLRLSADGLDGLATTVPGAPLGFEVVRVPPHGPHGPTARVLVHATGAAVPWRQAEPPPTAGEIPAGATLVWTAADAAAVSVARRERTPAWLAALDPGDAFERAARAALGTALVSGDPAEPALERLAGERRSERRIAAAATLSLIGRHEPLAGLLVEAAPRRMLRDEEWSRLARTAVPRALALGPPESDACMRALAAAAPAGTGPLLVRLAVGVDPATLDAAALTALVDALESPWLVVRRAAWQTLLTVDPPDAVDRLRYRPDRAAALNAEGVRWWRDRIATNRGAPGDG